MNVSETYITINTDEPETLVAFYRDTVGLEPQPDMGPHALKLGPSAVLWFDSHVDTSGENREPSRVLLSLAVDDAKAERERMESAGARFIRKEGTEFWGGIISTFIDPDGNYGQLIQYDPALDQTKQPVAAGAQG